MQDANFVFKRQCILQGKQILYIYVHKNICTYEQKYKIPNFQILKCLFTIFCNIHFLNPEVQLQL